MVEVEDILSLYAHPSILSKAALLLGEYRFNKPEVNRAIVKLFHRVAYDLKKPAMCFQASIFHTLQRINRNQARVRSDPVVREIWRFGKFLLNEFFRISTKNEKLPLELLFWTTPSQCERVQEGSYEKVKAAAKSAQWTDEQEDELRQLTAEALRDLERAENVPNVTDFMVDYVADQFTDDSKTTAQIRRRMMKMGLVQKAKNRPKSRPQVHEREEVELDVPTRRVGIDYENLPSEDVSVV